MYFTIQKESSNKKTKDYFGENNLCSEEYFFKIEFIAKFVLLNHSILLILRPYREIFLEGIVFLVNFRQ